MCPLPLEPPSHPPPSIPLCHHRAQGWVICVIQHLPTILHMVVCIGSIMSWYDVKKMALYIYDHPPPKLISSVKFSSVAQSCPTFCDPMDYSTPGLPVHHQLPELTQTHVHWVSDAIQPSHPLSSSSPPAFDLSQHQSLFNKNESVLRIRWPKYWSFSFSISPSNEQSRLISFRMDWLDLLAVQGTLKSLLQHHSSKASILWCSAFFTVQLSHPYMTTGKIIALTRWTFVGKV